MKKRLLLLLAVMLTAVASGYASVNYYLQEGFESGIPATWSQVASVDTAMWSTETLATRPSLSGLSALSTVPEGEAYAFERFSSGGRYATVRLITPALSFTGADVYQPVLSFKYAQMGRNLSGVYCLDTLRLYYRTSATGAWTLIQTYSDATTNWTEEEIILPGVNVGMTYYQIAFEAKEADGLGVYLDDVRVRNTSQCVAVSGVTIAPNAAGADISWQGDFSDVQFDVAVYDHEVTPVDSAGTTSAGTPVFSQTVTGAYSVSIASGLQPLTTYYAYVRGYCSDNESGYTEWAGNSFRTRASIATLPYKENFDSLSSYGEGTTTIAVGALPDGWTRAHSDDVNTNAPGVISNTNFSLDGSHSLYLGTNPSSPTTKAGTLAAGQYVIAALPEIAGTSLNQLQVSFWAGAYLASPGIYAPQLEVGVMSNPDDASTFTSLETVKIDAVRQFKKAVVSLASYTGTGHYVAFRALGADLQNAVSIDDIVVEQGGVAVPSQLAVSAITPASMTITADKHNADSWNIRVAEGYYRDSVPAEILGQTGITAGQVTLALPDSLQGKVVTVYAQGVKNGEAGAWSFPLTVRIPAQMADTVPLNFSFASVTTILAKTLQNELKSPSNAPIPDFVYLNLHDFSYLPTISSKTLNLSKAGNYFTLGYMPTLNTKEVTFYLRGSSTAAGEVVLGVMTNPYDEDSFEQLAVYQGEKSTSAYSKCVYDLDQYQGQGHYLAFKSNATYNYIQKIDIDSLPTCREVATVDCQAKSNKAVLTWPANNMTEWQVVVSENSDLSSPIVDSVVTTSSCTVTGLTSEKTYYYKVNGICGTDTIVMYATRNFTTPLGIPYEVEMDGSTVPSNLTRMSGLASDIFAGSSMTTATSGWSPQASTSSYCPSGMGNNMKVNIYGYNCKYWMLTPALALDVDAGTSVRLTFDAAWTKYNSTSAASETGSDDKFMVAVSDDGGATWSQANASIWGQAADCNMGTIDDNFSASAKSVSIDLSQYVGKSIKVGFYAESTTTNGDNDFHVANIKIASFDPNCPGVSTVSVLNFGSDNATLSWTMNGTQSADVQVATSSSYADSTLVYNQTISGNNSTQVTGLSGNTTYYARVKQTCDPNQSYQSTKFKTLCSAMTPAEIGTETFSDEGHLDCWIVGHTVDSTSNNNDPAVASVTGFGNVLKMAKTYTSNADGLYAIMPALNLGSDTITKYQVSFDAFTNSKKETDVNRLVVKVITDPSDAATWVDARTVKILSATDSTNMKQYVVSFANVETDYNDEYGKYIGFYFLAGTDSTNTVYIDNVMVEQIPSCPQVEEVNVNGITGQAAVLRWSKTQAPEYQAAVFTAKSVDSAMVANQIVTTDTFAVSGLEGNTPYYAAVRAICGAGDTAKWSPLTAFRTECMEITEYPWTENFDSIAKGDLAIDCWTNEHIQGSGTYLMQIDNSTNGSNSTNQMYLRDQAAGNVTRVALPYMMIPEANAYEFRMDMYRSSYSSSKPNEGFLITVESDLGTDTLGFIPRQYDISNDYVDAASEIGWYRYAFTIPQAGGLHVVVYGMSEYGKASYADNFEVRQIPTCPTPKHLKAVTTALDSAQITWQGTSANGFVVMLSDVADFSNMIDSVVVSDTTYTFHNLASSSTYYVRVQGNCPDADDPAECTFKTLMGLPYVEDFQDGTSVPEDWKRYTGDIYSNPTLSETSYGWTVTTNDGAGLTANHAYCSAYYSSYTDYKYTLGTPEIMLNNKAGNNIKLSFDLGLVSSSSGSTAPTASVCDGRHFSVALAVNDSIVPIMVWSDSTANMGLYSDIPATARNYEMDLTQYAGKRVQVLFYHSIGTSTSSYYSYVHLDNVKLQSLNMACLAPDMTIKEVTTDSVAISVPNADKSTYEVQLAASKGFATVLDSVTINDTIASFHGLKAASTYYVRAKKICSATEESSWSDAVSFTTACAVVELPYAEDFNSLSEGIPNCWDNSENSVSQDSYNWNYYASSACLRFNSYSAQNGQYSYLATPEISLAKPATLTFDAKNPAGGDLSVYISQHGASTKTLLKSGLTSLSNFTTEEIDLSAYTGDTVTLYFKATSNYGSGDAYIYLDNVALTENPACSSIKSIAFENVQRRSLDIVWTPKSPADHYDVIFSDSVLNDSLLAAATPITVDTAYYHVEDLTRGTNYFVYVRCNCGAEAGMGEWLSATVKTKALQACETVTAADGTETSNYAPIYGYYIDNTQKSQAIYPASMLTGLNGQKITGLKYYLASGGSEGSYGSWDATFNVKLANVTGQSLASDFVTTTMTTVYSDVPTASVADGMVITFSTPFTYTGGDLLIEFEEPMAGSNYSAATFYGAQVSSGSRYQYGSWSNYSMNFLPKVDFTYCYQTAACPAVDTASYELPGDGTTQAKISWGASTGDYANTYMFCYADNDTIAPDSIQDHVYTGIDSLSISLSGLTADTYYYGYIKTVCDAEGHDDGTSSWYKIEFQTNPNCPAVVDLQAAPTGKNSAEATWTTVYAEQDKTFQYILSVDSLGESELASANWLDVDTTVLTWDTLSCGQTYYLYVASQCGAINSKVRSARFTQPQHCPAVQNLRAVATEFNAVQLAWDKGDFGEETQWEVGIQGGQSKIVSDQSTLLIGLEANTDYVAYVQAICSESEAAARTTLDFHTPVHNDEQEIGVGTSAGYNAPFNNYYKNAWNQAIYPADSIGRTGVIEKIYYHCATAPTTPLVDTTRIYMGYTDETYTSSTTDWVSLNDLTEVYSDVLVHTAAADEWLEIPLQESFTYNGTDNLVIVVSSKRATYSSQLSYYYTTGDYGVDMYRQNDGDASYAEHPGTASGTRASQLPNIRLGFEAENCAKVARLKTDTILKDSVVISWFPGGSETSWNTLLSTTQLDESALNNAKCDTVADYQKHIGGLTEDTDYYFYVRSSCGAGGYSDWKELHFITDASCRAPKDIHADTITGSSAKLSWSNASDYLPAGYVLAYGKADQFNLDSVGSYQTLNLTDTTVELTGLNGLTNYKVVLASACDAQHQSRWSDVFEFQTECGVSAVPWSESFDGTPNLTCWTIPAGVGLYNSNTSYVRTGKSLQYSGTAATVTILPDFGDLNGLQMSFWYRCEGSSSTSMGKFQGGYITDPSDSTTFVSLIDLDRVYEYTEVEVPYVSGIPAGSRPAIRYYDATSANYWAFIDDVKMDSIPKCFKPLLNVTGSTCTSLTVSLGDSASYLVELAGDNSFAQLTDSVVVNDSVVIFRNLVAGHTYYVRAQRVCSETLSSAWSLTQSGRTSYGIPFTETFSDGMPDSWSKASGLASDVFAGSQLSTSSSSGWSSQLATSSYCPSGMGDNMKVNVYGTNCKYWLLTPVIDMTDTAAYDAVRLSFDAAWTKYNSSSAASGAGQDDKFMVAVSLDGGQTWDQANAFLWSNDGSGNMGTIDGSFTSSSQSVKINLTPYIGHSIVVGFYGESTVTNGDNDFHVGNVQIAAFNPNCAGIQTITASNLTTKSADISYTFAGGNRDAYIEVAASENFQNPVVQDTVRGDSTYHVAGLAASTTYYVRIKQLCDDGEESGYIQTSFQTSMGLPLKPDFGSKIPAGWTSYKYLVTDAVQTFATSDFSTTSSGWSHKDADTVINVGHVRGEIWSTGFQYWLVSPAIDLTENVGDGIMLNVDLGLTPYGSYYRDSRNTGTDDRFMVVVSTDGGVTWDQANATVWDNDSTTAFSEQHLSYNGIPEHGTTYRINMTPYAGKVIALGFYGESTVSNADNYFHFGNINLKQVASTNLEDQICAGDAYNKNGFSISGQDLMNPGDYTFNNYTPAIDSLHHDSITILTLHAMDGGSTEYSTTLCEGESFNDYGFQFTASKTTQSVMRHVATGSNGCDSTTVLYITVNPILTSSVQDSVKKGDIYTWHGQNIDKAGTYTDTLTSEVTGCDSVATLILTYKTVDALNDLNYFSMQAMPNPVEAGQSFWIVGEFGTGNATLRMHNLTGALIEETRVKAENRRLEVTAPAVPGAYLIDLQTEDKKLFRTKILVK